MKIYLLIISFTLSFIGFGQYSFQINEKHEKKISKLIKSMSLDEKVGQTCQITLDAILKRNADKSAVEPATIDKEKLKTAFSKYKVGSILNVSSHTLSVGVWENIFSQIKEVSDELKLDIPIIYGIDAIHGVNYTKGATLFPQEIGLAATWNRKLAREFAGITAYEMRATDLRWNFSPVLDLGRQPLWSRFFETLGEDPYLCSELGEEIIFGYQGTSEIDAYHVASCLKHFVGYSAPFSGRDRTPAWIPTKAMKELYLPSFKTAIDAGAMTLMINSGDVNGIPGHANKNLLTDILKDEWGFKGFTVSDWEDFIMLETVHDVSSNLQEAIVLAFNSGVDMSMVPNNPQYQEYCEMMIKAVCEKQISMERLDDAIRRILRVKMALGLFSEEGKADSYPLFASEEHKMKSYDAAGESITLLKNDKNILPFALNTKVLVTGAAADNLNMLNGAWTHTWQGMDARFNTEGCVTIFEAIKEKVGESNCLYSKGVDLFYKEGWETDKLADIEDFKTKAAASDVIVICLGELPATEKPGDIHSLDLSPAQMELAEIAFKLNMPVVLVLVEGRPRVIHELVEKSAAIVQTYLPGDYGAKALTDILFGEINPSGKLPYTYPKYNGVLEYYDRPKSVDRSGKTNKFDAFDPEWEFGFGMSYTTFAYSDFKINKTSIGLSDTININVTVTNSGMREGKEVVQLYLSDRKASYVPAGKRLRGFEKVTLAPNESKVVNFELSAKDFQFSDSNGEWLIESGDFTIRIGKNELSFELLK